jgi:uncharacterized membrane protein YhaH (DUF805 family)
MSFKGRLSRAPFWWTSLALWAVFAVLFVFLDRSLGRPSTLILYPPFFWIAAALIVRRFHDRGQSGWWFWVGLIPILGPLWLIATLAISALAQSLRTFDAADSNVELEHIFDY